jgi:hypothetical protein
MMEMVKQAFKQMITPRNEAELHIINQMPSKIRDYAHAWLDHLKNGAAAPNPEAYGLFDTEAQQARIALAAVL